MKRSRKLYDNLLTRYELVFMADGTQYKDNVFGLLLQKRQKNVPRLEHNCKVTD